MSENFEMKSIEAIEAVAEQGDMEAQLHLGRMYGTGEGTEVNYEKALYWWENYRRRTMSLKAEDFGTSNSFSKFIYCNVFIWGEETKIRVDKKEHSLEKLVPLINKLISYLNHNEDIVFKAIVDDAGMLKQAEYYIDCMEEAEGSTEECRVFILEDGTVVTLPLAKEDFIESLHLNEVFIEFDNEEQDISASLVFHCMPDYFADPETDHIIAVKMDSKGNISSVELIEI